jgi:hypothetical protein
MSLQAIYASAAALCFVAELGLLAILIARRQYKSFPTFTLYITYNVLSDVAAVAIGALYSAHAGRLLQFASLPLQYLLELAVLFEIAWNVLRPVHASLPRGAIRFFVSLMAVAIGCGILLASNLHGTADQIDAIRRPLDLTVGLLRLLIFAVTAGFAQVLGIGWKNKVFQLATALSFYSAVDLMVTLWERHQGNAALDPIRAFAYLLELGFLVWAFTTKEVRRGEFSPQMEQFLVTLAGRAKHARTSLVRIR